MPIFVVIRIDRAMAGFPCGICNWPLGDYAHLLFARDRQSEIDCFLVGDADRRLQRIERAAFNRELRGVAVSAVTNVTRVTFVARGLQRINRFAFAQLDFRTAVQLHEVEPIGLKALQAALDTLEDRRLRPVRAAFHSVRMAALGEQVKIAAPFAHRLADQFLAIVITFGGVDDVQPSVERAVQQFGHRLRGRALIADLRSAESDDGNLHVSLSEPPLFHR